MSGSVDKSRPTNFTSRSLSSADTRLEPRRDSGVAHDDDVAAIEIIAARCDLQHTLTWFLCTIYKFDTNIVPELEIGGFASPNANHFWGISKSIWPTDLQYFWVTASQFRLIANHFC